jgi:hypothetical protein
MFFTKSLCLNFTKQFMKFQSRGQYFYSLYTILFALALVPLTLIGLFHYINLEPVFIENHFGWLIPAFLGVADVVVFEFLHRKNLKATFSVASLSDKLKKYFALTIVRYAGLSFALHLIIAGYFLLRDDRLTYLFMLLLLYIGFQWPTISRVCDELKLSRDECAAFRQWK